MSLPITPKPKAVSLNDISPLLLGLINEGIDVTFTVTGCSMSPLWRNLRDSVVLTGCDPLTLKKGQVPLFKRENGQYVLHRIIRVNKNSYDMLGDNQTEIERGVPKSAVLCVVKGFNRKGKYYSCDSRLYRLYVFAWVNFRHLRRFMLSLILFFKKIFKGDRNEV